MQDTGMDRTSVSVPERRDGWIGVAVAWVCVSLIELVNVPNEAMLALLVMPVELVLWLVAGWLTLRLTFRARRSLLRTVVALGLAVSCAHFTNWSLFHPVSYYVTHKYAFDAVAAQVREGAIGSSDDYYGSDLPLYLRDLSTTGKAAVIGRRDGRPVVFLPQFLGIPDDAAGYAFFDGPTSPSIEVDLFGARANLPGGINLRDGWWYLRPGD
ncbi:hypothetical protein [Dactylosporangium sp. NPDC006015]|uniref:hypothetical protein n=1 Tax=Dactylosporangium sp. NPDC006015 TaxID=3154576 RepID=UPI0033B3698A